MKKLAIILLILVTSNSFAMRCGTKLVSEGDYETKLLRLCGEPRDIINLGNRKVYIYNINGRDNEIVVQNGRIWEMR